MWHKRLGSSPLEAFSDPDGLSSHLLMPVVAAVMSYFNPLGETEEMSQRILVSVTFKGLLKINSLRTNARVSK